MALNETARTLLNTFFRTANQPQALSICMALADSLEENNHPASAAFRHVFAGLETAVPIHRVIRRAMKPLKACAIFGNAQNPQHPLTILPQRTWPRGNERQPAYHISVVSITRQGQTVPWQDLSDDILLHLGLSRLTALWAYSHQVRHPVSPGERLAGQWNRRTRSRQRLMEEVRSLSMADLCRFFFILGRGVASPSPLAWQLENLLRNLETGKSPSPELPPEE